jgi:type IV secretory pathway component VirB8
MQFQGNFNIFAFMKDKTPQQQAEEIETGSYYIAARKWYSELYHTPIAERSFYIVMILLCIVNMYFSLIAFIAVFPIKPMIPFVTYSDDVFEDLPRIKKISTEENEDRNVAVMKFLVEGYLKNRESYDLKQYEQLYRNIWSQSTKEVFDAYKKDMDPTNPYSPYRLYTNKDRRFVDIISENYDHDPANPSKPSKAEIIFETSVINIATNHEIDHARWRADITYKYTNYIVDQSLDHYNEVAHMLNHFIYLTPNSLRRSGDKRRIVPMTFIVSDYQVKELLE